MKNIRVKAASRLLDFLLGFGYTKTKAKQLLKHRAVSVNNRVATGHDYQLSAGDLVSLETKPQPGRDILEEFGIDLVYEDDAVLVIKKPSGLLTIATESEKQETAYYLMNAFFKERNPTRPDRIYIVHRLDRETSGLIVFAKNEGVKRKLQDDWVKADKQYHAVVEGAPPKKEGRIESYLGETKSFRVYSAAQTDETKHAVTRYTVLKAGKIYSLLELTLETGRKHQIRVHMSDMGCPVAGDKKYGAKTNPLRRIALHASGISFVHPVTRKIMSFIAPLPKSFSTLVR